MFSRVKTSILMQDDPELTRHWRCNSLGDVLYWTDENGEIRAFEFSWKKARQPVTQDKWVVLWKEGQLRFGRVEGTKRIGMVKGSRIVSLGKDKDEEIYRKAIEYIKSEPGALTQEVRDFIVLKMERELQHE